MFNKDSVKRSMRAAALVAGVAAMALVALPTASQAAQRHKTKAATEYYVSVGDSYSVGYQPSPTAGATPGYTAYVAKAEKLTLENFGCGGATTTSILSYTGVCSATPTTGEYGPPAATDLGPVIKGNTQVQNAVAFIAANKGHIGLITVSISGNDLTPCATSSNPIGCVAGVVGSIKTNVITLAKDLLSAAGSGVPLIGITYPDVFLGEWVFPPTNQSLATESQTAFEDDINPALSTAYTSAGGAFVNVTEATGGYGSLTKLTTLKPYGKIPVPVADVCKITWFCSLGNIHANTAGYTEIGKLIAAEYKTLHASVARRSER